MKKEGFWHSVFYGDYREITWAGTLFGVGLGIVMAMATAYVGMKIGFVVPGSLVAATLGWGFLRGVLKRGTIIENNAQQTIATSVQIACSGVIFTLPVLYLRGMEPHLKTLFTYALAACAGALLGNAFIIPLRKQMIELERLRFPSGIAIATLLRSSSGGLEKSRLLIYGALISSGIFLLEMMPNLKLSTTTNISFMWLILFLIPLIYWLYATIKKRFSVPVLAAGYVVFILIGIILFKYTPVSLPETVDIGALLGMKPYWHNVWALSLLSLGAGFISGKPGATVVLGGILANFIIAPLVVFMQWDGPAIAARKAELIAAGQRVPEMLELQADSIYRMMNRPMGIGMLIGGALMGVFIALPSIRAAFSSMKRAAATVKGGSDEMPLSLLNYGIVGAFAVLTFAAYMESDIGIWRALLTAFLGTAWMWLAGIIVAQCTGMTDWSPLSGLALIAVTIILFLTDKHITASVLIGGAVCVATSECADLMTDLKTGFLMGSKPFRLQSMHILLTWLGPIFSIVAVAILWKAYGFGAGKSLSAPQAQALDAAISGVIGGGVPYAKYFAGAIIGALLSASGIYGLGVMVGLSMYLPMEYILTFAIGCLLSVIAEKYKGSEWCEEVGVPVASGFMLGEAMIGIGVAIIIVVTSMIRGG